MSLDMEKIKKRLFDEREKILTIAGAGNKAAETVELDQTLFGRLSRMDALQAQAVSAEAKRRREARLRAIDAAIRRVETGDYGYCVRCEEEITPERLEIDPAAFMCVACANKSGSR
ncbi:MAG: TraR/DksA family transcriptional regulator [Candidatus Nitrospinota bacterium M3_3B_026]